MLIKYADEIKMCVMYVCKISVLMMQNQLKNQLVRTAVYVSVHIHYFK